jgi:hypothetical protein
MLGADWHARDAGAAELESNRSDAPLSSRSFSFC